MEVKIYTIQSFFKMSHLLRESHRSDARSGGKFEKGWFRRTHPAQEKPERRVISEGNHGFQYPEDGSVMSQKVVLERDVFLGDVSLIQKTLYMFVEPRFVPAAKYNHQK